MLLALIASVCPVAMLEIGVNDGLTARAILACVGSLEHYQGVDVPRDYVPACEVQRNEVPLNPGHLVAADARFELVLRPRGSLDLTAADLRPCDAVFIDGDHGREAVLHDSALALSVLRPGGIVIWHDYNLRPTVDVSAVLHEFAAEGRTIKHVEDTWIAYEVH